MIPDQFLASIGFGSTGEKLDLAIDRHLDVIGISMTTITQTGKDTATQRVPNATSDS